MVHSSTPFTSPRCRLPTRSMSMITDVDVSTPCAAPKNSVDHSTVDHAPARRISSGATSDISQPTARMCTRECDDAH